MRKKIFFSALIFFSCASKNPLNPENIIDIKIPTQYRDLYLKFRHGDKITKNDQKKIISVIKLTLKQHYQDEQDT